MMLTTWRMVLVQDDRWEFEVDTVASSTLPLLEADIVEESSPKDVVDYKYKGG
jgi:hypothetical protein